MNKYGKPQFATVVAAGAAFKQLKDELPVPRLHKSSPRCVNGMRN